MLSLIVIDIGNNINSTKMLIIIFVNTINCNNDVLVMIIYIYSASMESVQWSMLSLSHNFFLFSFYVTLNFLKS